MAGSPIYLNLLATAAERAAYYDTLDPHSDPAPPSYEELFTTWFAISSARRAPNYTNLNRALFKAAVMGIRLWTRGTGQTIPQWREHARSLHLAKNAGYAGRSDDPWANFRVCEDLGFTPIDGVLIRLSDKHIRIANLRADPNLEQVGEAVFETLDDYIAYALIGMALYEE